MSFNDNSSEKWLFFQGAHHESSPVNEFIRFLLRPTSPAPFQKPRDQSEMTEDGLGSSRCGNLLLAPPPVTTRRYSDTSVGPSSETKGEESVSMERQGRRLSLNPTPHQPPSPCQACLSLFLIGTCADRRHSPYSLFPLPHVPDVRRGSFSETSDLSQLNKSLESITGHRHQPERGRYQPARSHSDEGHTLEPPSDALTSRRRASFCAGELSLADSVGGGHGVALPL